MQTIKLLKKKDLNDKRVLLRVDFNVAIHKDKIVEDFRIKQALPTIKYLREKGAKVILISHLGDDGKDSLKPVAKYLNKFFPVRLAENLDDKVLSEIKTGEVVLVENIRRYEGEKKNDLVFAKQLASIADLYVNEAFSVSHRENVSVSGVTKYLPVFAGLHLTDEVKQLTKVLTPKKPLVVILGGAKFQTKIPLVKKMQKNADQIFLAGALINSFFKAQGYEVGLSLVEENVDYLKPYLKNKKIILPIDVYVVEKKTGKKTVKKPSEIGKDDVVVDIGPQSIEMIREAVKLAKTALWNGPTGWFEAGHKVGTTKIAQALADSKSFSVIGGGDTLVALKNFKQKDKFSFISTGGGAMMDFLASDGKLPGLKNLSKSKK